MKNLKSLFFNNKKKGNLQISLTELIGALLALIILLSLFYIGGKLFSIFISNKDYSATIESFDLLGGKIDELLKDKNFANKNILYFLDTGYILVGFNYRDRIEMKTCQDEKLTETRKRISGLCGKACLCIFKKTLFNNFDDDFQVPLKCNSFDKNIVFLAPEHQEYFCSVKSGWNPSAYDEYYKKEIDYKFLILHGFDTKEIYLDKYESEDGNIFIYFAEFNDETQPILDRRKVMDEKYYKKNSEQPKTI